MLESFFFTLLVYGALLGLAQLVRLGGYTASH